MILARGRESLLTPAFVALTGADLLYFSATGVLLAATPIFVRDELHSNEAGVGLAMGAFAVTTLLLRPFAGRWTDRHGRRGLLVAGSGAFAVVALGHLLAESLPVLVAIRLVLGAAEACFFVAGFAALADLAPVGRAGEALSLNSLSLYAGIAVGPLLGQAALHWGGFSAAWLLASTLGAGAALLASRVPETHGEPEPGGGRLVHPAAIWPGLALFVGVGVTGGFLAFAVLHARDVGLAAWGVVPLTFGATVVTLRIAFARLPDRVNPVRLFGAALVADAGGLGLLGAWESPAGLVAGALLLGAGTAFITPAVFTAVFTAVGPAERGSAAATTSVFIDLGLSGGPIAVGTVAAATGIAGSFLWWSLLPLGAGLLALARSGRRVGAR